MSNRCWIMSIERFYFEKNELKFTNTKIYEKNNLKFFKLILFLFI